MSLDSQRQMGVRKSEVTAVLEDFFTRGGEAKCPAAQIGYYSDTRNRYLNCKVEDQQRPGQAHFPIAENPLSVMMWCCDSYGECPVWQASKERDPILDRVRQAAMEAESKATQEREIASGARVDDRPAGVVEAAGAKQRQLDERAIEKAAELQRAKVEKHWSEGPKPEQAD